LLDVCHHCHCKLHTCQSCGRISLKAAEIKAGLQLCKSCRSVK
jgi:hypothetical protein